MVYSCDMSASLFIDNVPVGTLKEARRAVAMLNNPDESLRIRFSGVFLDPAKAVLLRPHAEYIPEDAVYLFDCRPWRKGTGYDYGPQFRIQYRCADRSFKLLSRKKVKVDA